MEELRQLVLYTTLELQTTRLIAQEEITKLEQQLTHFKQLLIKTTTEKDEALHKYQSLLLQQQWPSQTRSRVSSIEFEQQPIRNRIESNIGSDSDDSVISSPPNDSVLPETALRLISGENSLPEKGKLLEAVINTGPLLQTLLLAGNLPKWRHPPPVLEAFEIPPVSIPAISSPEELMSNATASNRKRGYFGTDSSPEVQKYRRLVYR